MTDSSGAPPLPAIRSHRSDIVMIGARRGVSNIRVVQPEIPAAGVVELLVDFDLDHPGLDLFGFAEEVSELLGQRVDVGTRLGTGRADLTLPTVVAL